MQDLENDIAEVRSAPTTLDLSPQLQNLIKRLFTFSKTKEVGAIEGAIALAKFGQYEEAVNELQKLLKDGVLPTVAAKNILALLPFAFLTAVRCCAVQGMDAE